MPYLPHSAVRRADRARLSELTPVVLRFMDGNRAAGTLKVISVTGGLLAVQRPITQGAKAKLMFLTRAGSVLGVAEMLSPLSWDQQPFRFVSLHHEDAARLEAAVQSSRELDRREHNHIKREIGQVDNFRAW